MMLKLASITVVILGIAIASVFMSDYKYILFRKMVEIQFSKMKAHSNDIGSFCLKYSNGKVKRFVGLGESFVDGDWNVTHGDLADSLVHLAFKLHIRDYSMIEKIVSFLNPGEWQNYLERMSVTKSIKEDKYTISHHYDTGNDFYLAFLGNTMMYSCAFYANNKNKNGNYRIAQENKINVMINKMDIKPNDNVLDVGSGWGYMASFIVNRTRATVTGIALSKQQIKWSKNVFNKDNLNTDAPKYYYADYREYCTDIKNKGAFNKIYSIGMLEHVHSKRIDEFMKCMFDLFMDEDANNNTMIMGLHYISRNNIFPAVEPLDWSHLCDTVTFVGKYLLPGGCLLHNDWVQRAALNAGFVQLHKESYGLHYARTTREWRYNIMRNWDEMVKNHPNYDMRLYKSYLFLFATAEVGFRMGFMDLTHQIFIKPSKKKSGFVDGKMSDVMIDITNVNQRDMNQSKEN
eukprot:24851_1